MGKVLVIPDVHLKAWIPHGCAVSSFEENA